LPAEVAFMRALPKSLVGKVLKKELRKLDRG
jgi:acyl-coenzyme A synthetase/AMP-(fatty) acid ligase